MSGWKIAFLPLFFCFARASDPCFDLRILLLQDISGSYMEDLPVLKEKLPEIVEGLSKSHPGAEFGMASFTDLPIMPFGCSSEDFCFHKDLNFTTDVSLVREALDGLTMRWGVDPPEAHLTALHHIAQAGHFPSETTGASGQYAVRLLVMSTDAAYHNAGDAAEMVKDMENIMEWCGDYPDCCPDSVINGEGWWSVRPNDGDDKLSCDQTSLEFEDYPSFDETIDALIRADVFLLILAAGEHDQWVDFSQRASAKGLWAHMLPLASDSSNIEAALAIGLNLIEAYLCRAPSSSLAVSTDEATLYTTLRTTPNQSTPTPTPNQSNQTQFLPLPQLQTPTVPTSAKPCHCPGCAAGCFDGCFSGCSCGDCAIPQNVTVESSAHPAILVANASNATAEYKVTPSADNSQEAVLPPELESIDRQFEFHFPSEFDAFIGNDDDADEDNDDRFVGQLQQINDIDKHMPPDSLFTMPEIPNSENVHNATISQSMPQIETQATTTVANVVRTTIAMENVVTGSWTTTTTSEEIPVDDGVNVIGAVAATGLFAVFAGGAAYGLTRVFHGDEFSVMSNSFVRTVEMPSDTGDERELVQGVVVDDYA